MARQPQDTESLSAMELTASHGMEKLPQAVASLINEAMRLERAQHPGAERYERTEE